MNVRGRESQEMKSSIHQPVLSAVVLDQAFPVVAPVILENQAHPGVVEIGSTQKSLVVVTEIRLNLWGRQAPLDQEPAKPGLHRRLGGSRENGQRAKSGRARATAHGVGVAPNSGRIGQAYMDRHINCDKSFHRRQSVAEIQQCAGKCRRAEPSDGIHFARRDLAAAHAKPGARSDAGPGRHNYVDWIDRIKVETQDPGCSRGCEDSVSGKPISPRGEQ